MFGRTAVWQDCVPGGDGGAHLAFDGEQAYVDGLYRFLDADGKLVEAQIQWCKLVINADGLKLAIILPVGFVVAVALFSKLFQWRTALADAARAKAYEEDRRKTENSTFDSDSLDNDDDKPPSPQTLRSTNLLQTAAAATRQRAQPVPQPPPLPMAPPDARRSLASVVLSASAAAALRPASSPRASGAGSGAAAERAADAEV